MDISIFVNLLVWLLIFGLLFWLVDVFTRAGWLPDPLNKVSKVVLVVIVVLFLINFLLGVIGSPIIRLR
jgi:hypothetical protein